MTSEVIDERPTERDGDGVARRPHRRRSGGDLMATTGSTVDRYLEFWNAASPAEQRRLAPSTFTDDVEYLAPIGALSGPEALVDFRTQLTEHTGPVTLCTRAEPEQHHDRIRLEWEIRLESGESFAAGTDVLVVHPDGRISGVCAFLDRAPEGFDPHAHQ
jgi:hypothetical protein